MLGLATLQVNSSQRRFARQGMYCAFLAQHSPGASSDLLVFEHVKAETDADVDRVHEAGHYAAHGLQPLVLHNLETYHK